jgi:hypothetical protein
MSSNVKRLRKLFPRCPICKSKRGYGPSLFYPDVKCKSCGAEWALNENGMMLKQSSKLRWDAELLNKKYPFDFWKNLRAPQFQVKEQMFAPMDYVGGNHRYKKPAIGYIFLRSDSITYKTSEGSLSKMNLNIPIEKLKILDVLTADEIVSSIGAGEILFKASKDYLVLGYERQTRKLQHLILDFHGQKKSVDELKTIVGFMKKAQGNAQ